MEKVPGLGAEEFAQELAQYTKDDEHTRKVIHELIHFHMLEAEIYEQLPEIHRIKLCTNCKQFYRDKTRPNNSKTCSKECKTKRDTERRQSKVDKKRMKDLDKMTRIEKYYYDHYEYSFWNMIEPEDYHEDYEILSDPHDMSERIDSQYNYNEFDNDEYF